MTNVARICRPAALGVATAVLGLLSASCGSGSDNSSGSDGAKAGNVKYSGLVSVSRDSALVLSESSGEMKFGRVKSDGIVFGAAKAAPKSLLLDGMETPSGEWLAVTATCMEDSGAPCSEQTVYRVSADMKQAKTIALGSATATDQLRVKAASESGTFVVERSNDTSVQLGTVDPKATSVAWFWESDSFDLAAIRAAANASQDFESSRPPTLDACAAGDRFIWRFAVGTTKPQGWSVDAGSDKARAVWVPQLENAGTFACTADKFVTFSTTVATGTIERTITDIDVPQGQERKTSTSSIHVEGIADTELRPGGGIVAEMRDLAAVSTATTAAPVPGETTPPDGADTFNPTPTVVVFWPSDAAKGQLLLDGPVNGRNLVSDAGTLLGSDFGDEVESEG